MSTAGTRARVFGIGLNKTGTSTLGACGAILGYRCSSCDRALLEDVVRRRDLARLRQVAAGHDLFEDWPWPLVYREMDALFPGSRFILTVRRSAEAWLDSLLRHSLRTHPWRHCRKLAYGYHFPHRHRQAFLDFYRRHNQAARDYFHGRPGDFLEVCWEDGDGWDKLCGFLQQPLPAAPFPHVNRGADQAGEKPWWQPCNRLLSLTGL